MKSRTAGRASLEIKRLDKWWRANRDYKDVFIDEFESIVQVIEEKPHLGTPYPALRYEGLRYMRMRKTRYNVFYIVEADEVVIIAVWGAERGHGPKL